MNYKEIEKLKLTITNLIKQGCRLRVPAYGIEGRIVGVGFKPYWTNPSDSKIEKLEISFLDNAGRIVPFTFNFITGYDVVEQDNRRFELSKNISLDIQVYSPKKDRAEEPLDKIRIEIASAEKK